MQLKLVVSFLVLTLVNVSLQQAEMAALMVQTIFGTEAELKEKCQVTTDISLESLFMKSDKVDSDETLRCFVKCVFVKYGVLSETGIILVENLKKTVDIPDELLTALKENCSNFNKDDLCTGAKEFIDCSIKYAEDMMSSMRK